MSSGIGRRIVGTGPIPCDLFICGEWASKDDASTGRPFSAKGRRTNEIDRYLDGVRLPARHDCYCTVWVKEWCGPEGDYTSADFERDEPALITELQAVRPKYIICLGRHITQWFLGDVDMESSHAIPWYLPIDSPRRTLFEHPEEVVIFPIYNPAAGFRSPELSAAVTYDFSQLEGVLDGTIGPRILYDDPIPNPVYEEVLDVETVDHIMLEANTIEFSCDTEGWAHNVWSVQLTTRPGHAYIIRNRWKALVDRFVEWVNSDLQSVEAGGVPVYRFVFHSALHELNIFRAIGIDTRYLTFDDTMQMAFVLQLEPQGLKPLGARHCNMKMDHYDDVMGDANFRLAQDWLLSCWENEQDGWETRCLEEFTRLTTTPYTDAKGKVHPGRRLSVHPKLPKSDLFKSVERCLRSKDPRKLWGDQVLDRHIDARPQYGAMWAATLDHVPLDVALHYAGRDADCTHRLKPRLVERLAAANLSDTYQADLATIPLIDRMQQIGLKPDLAHFSRLSTDLGFEIVEIKTRIASQLLAGSEGYSDDAAWSFNPNSTDHVGELLFERFGITSLKRTPGGDPSTNDKVLEALEKDQRLPVGVRTLIGDIREYREVYKLKSTFVDQIPDFVDQYPYDGRIHCTFRLTRVVSGRLAASHPNVLALPKHGKFAKRFREGFVSGDGAVLASWDLSQIELRVLAHLSQDPVLLHAFRTGIDLHATLAQRIFGVAPKDQDKSKHRLPAKAVNFGIPMGMTNIGLCLELRKNGVDVSEDDAQRWLTETMTLYKDVPKYQQGKIAEARRYGFVTDLRGRRRYIGGIRSYDDAVRSEAERFAFSTPIQAGAQSVMKVAEDYVYRKILLPRWKDGDRVEPLLQIHDDLLMECDKRILMGLDTQMVYAMTQVPAYLLTVPIETSGECGDNWGHMIDIPDYFTVKAA
jgi:uracil-DNA glycosylase family 4